MESLFSNVLMFVLGLLGLSFLVTIHELGHFLVAKWNNVKVNTFSIGFGKKLIRYRHGETEYCISAIPFGGYVAMSGENPDTLEEGEIPDPRDFVAKSVGARAAIAFAGPFINIAFAFVLLMLLYMVGVQEPATNELIVGFVAKDSPAEVAGIQPGDTIVGMNDKPTQGWDDFREQIGVSLGAEVPLTVHRGGKPLTITVVPEELVIPSQDSTGSEIKMGIGDIGIYPRNRVIVRIPPVEGSAAANAGILQNDTIFEINGEHISRYEEVVRIIDGSKGETVNVTVIRNGDTLTQDVRHQLENDDEHIPLFQAHVPGTGEGRCVLGPGFYRGCDGQCVDERLPGLFDAPCANQYQPGRDELVAACDYRRWPAHVPRYRENSQETSLDQDSERYPECRRGILHQLLRVYHDS